MEILQLLLFYVKCDKTKSIISLNKLITIPLGKDLFKRYRSLDKRI